MASLYLNIPLCSEDPKQMQQILTCSQAQETFRQNLQFKAGSIRENLASGEIDMSTFWGSSSMRAREMKPSLKYLYRKKVCWPGSTTWSSRPAAEPGERQGLHRVPQPA
jgi:spermidine/putrescine transport system substrate-binding protein